MRDLTTYRARFIPVLLLPQLVRLWAVSRTSVGRRLHDKSRRLQWCAVHFNRHHPSYAIEVIRQELERLLAFDVR